MGNRLFEGVVAVIWEETALKTREVLQKKKFDEEEN